ncbi:hypothetical protein HIM_05641 [Hirsutella minnesotensis 3608]|uniref:DNA-directed RNA polymerase II subunit RPB9-like zinc ribbon domain-containing protein n=1 Tax=Hirsutella minnesotensis 3608 TaxID=1043627 RepID=A0A0F7ZP55_9HYPO|nr:hypothetical protein HIM_05641 [Hirsutella minnesotensis 3608]
MASPHSTTSQEDAGPKKLEQITFRFCSECSNMLYPKEDEDAHKLQFTCRTCQYTEEAASTCVFRNVLNNSAGETAGVTQDVGSDPTVSELPPVFCLTCDNIISCGFCSQPAAYISVVPRERKREGDMSIAHFVLGLADLENADPFAEYDEEPEGVADGSADEGYSTADASTIGSVNDDSVMSAVTSPLEWNGSFGAPSNRSSSDSLMLDYGLGQGHNCSKRHSLATPSTYAMVVRL